MKDVYSPPRQRPHTDGEIAGFHATRDTEAHGIKALLQSAVHTLGAPGMWTKVLALVVPIGADAAAGIVKATHPDSPGGAGLTHDELAAIAGRAGRTLEATLLQELGHLVVPGLERAFATADGGPVPADAPPTPTLDPSADLSKATITPLPATSLGAPASSPAPEPSPGPPTVTRTAPPTLPPESVAAPASSPASPAPLPASTLDPGPAAPPADPPKAA